MPQAKQNQTTETQAQKRERERKEAAVKSAEGYKPREGKAFDGSRGYVTAQFDIAAEVEETYRKVLDERKEVREVLKSLHSQHLLTHDEAVLMFEIFPERESPNPAAKNTNGAQAATQDAATIPAAA